MSNNTVGLGNNKANLCFYIKNRPPLTQYENLAHIRPMLDNEIATIGQQTGNHWRKIFNVYAKLLFELAPMQFSKWQHLHDDYLLQAHSNTCLLFSAPNIKVSNNAFTKEALVKTHNKLHIILGKGYGESLALFENCTWLNNDFAVNFDEGIIICPYFDYRQLSNNKISQLVRLIQQLSPTKDN